MNCGHLSVRPLDCDECRDKKIRCEMTICTECGVEVAEPLYSPSFVSDLLGGGYWIVTDAHGNQVGSMTFTNQELAEQHMEALYTSEGR